MTFTPKQILCLISVFLLQTSMVLASPDEANTSATQSTSEAKHTKTDNTASTQEEEGIVIRRAFIAAVTEGNLPKLQAIVPSQLGPNEEVFGTGRPLYYAVKHGQVEMVQYLLAQGANANEICLDYSYWSSPRYKNTTSDVFKALVLLIRAGARMEKTASRGYLLKISIIKNYPDLFLAILETQFLNREDLQSREIHNYNSALETALELGHQEIVAIILNSKILDLKNSRNIQCFLTMLEKGFYDLADAWLKEVGDINEYLLLVISTYKECIDTIANYLSVKPHINETLLGRESQIMKALKAQSVEELLSLDIQFYFDASHTLSFYDIDPVDYILKYFSPDNIEKLLKNKLVFRTPTHLNPHDSRRNIKVAELLLRYQPSILFSIEAMHQLLHDAISCEDIGAIERFVGMGFSKGHEAVFLKRASGYKPNTLKFFIHPGPSKINNRLFSSNIEFSTLEEAAFFLQNGADINHTHGEALNKSVLLLSIERCQFLLNNGADIRLLRDETVLALLQGGNYRDESPIIVLLIKYLIEKGYQPGEKVINNSFFKSCFEQ